MKTYEIDVETPTGEGYDSDKPTEQAELLCFELRKILAGFSGLTLYQAESDDIEDLSTVFDGAIETFVDTEGDIISELGEGLEIPVPSIPTESILSAAALILSGAMSPVAAIVTKVVLPIVVRVIARKAGIPGFGGTGAVDLSAIESKLDHLTLALAGQTENLESWNVTALLNEVKDQTAAILQDSTGSVFKTYQEGEELEQGNSVFTGITALNERLSCFARAVEELQSIMESKAVSIMHTTQSDKVVYIAD